MNVGGVGLAVEQHEEAVVDDLLAAQVGLGDRVAVEEHHDGARVVGVPGLVAHVRARPARARRCRAGRTRPPWSGVAGEEAAAAEHGVVPAQPHEPARELEQVASRPRRGPSRPRRARCPGSRRCCCPAGCGRARRRARSSARPGRAAAWRGSCAAGAPRSALIAGSSVGPSTPQFQDRLWLSPSLLPSPLASLCFSLYETRSCSVKPSCAVTKLTLAIGRAAGVLVQVRRARQPAGELAERRRLAAPEVADGVAVLAVPLRPQRGEPADLVAAVADVPRLGDELDLGDDRVLLDEVEERRQAVDLVELAGQGRGEVEPEAVDVHLGDPVAQRVHDQLQHVRASA